jgi:hypothetical protein
MGKRLQDNLQNKFGKHGRKLARFGPTEHTVRSLFERYLARYEVEREG